MAKRMDIRKMWTVFEEYYAAQSKRFARDQPDPVTCLSMLKAAIVTQRGYEEALMELVEMRRREQAVLFLSRPSEFL